MKRLNRFMLNKLIMLFFSLFVLFFVTISFADEPSQPELKLQVLGSGGPNDMDGRASTGYLVWFDGEAKIMIDAGGGVSVNYGNSGANFNNLAVIAISHLHVDHSVDVFAMLKRGYFYQDRKEDLLIVGPTGNNDFPSMSDFMQHSVGEKSMVYPYLHNAISYKVKDVDDDSAVVLWESDDIRLSAISVVHANSPSLAFRVDTSVGSIGFSGDQDGRNPDYVKFIEGVDVLVAHLPNDEQLEETGHPHWHANPSTIGEIAAEAKVKKLVLSHFMENSLSNLPESLNILQKYYNGPVILADDLMTMTVIGDDAIN